MEGKPKVTKEVLCEESRFILANVLAEARYGRQNRYDDIRRVCEGAVSIPFSEYVGFLESAGYLRHDRESETLEVTGSGEEIVNGGNLSELTQAAVAHFKNARAMRRRKEGSASGASPMPDQSAPVAPPPPPPARVGAGSPAPLPEARRSFASGVSSGGISSGGISSGGRATAAVGGEIQRPDGGAADPRHEKLATIGSGGIGTVYRARQIPLGRLVALKEIRELFGFFPEDQHGEIVRRFTDVVRQAASLSHPNIAPIHEVNIDREFPYVVSELAVFGSARRLIQDAESIPVRLALRYLVQTLHALRAAHREQVFHRGLKPENMLIDAYGNVKLCDFGFARIVERDASVIRQVYVGMGAVAYMAPELFADPTSAGPQADIYALGIIFYELLASRLPGRRSPMPSDIDPKLPRGLDDIFDAMTRDSRQERYPSVDDVLEDFDKIEGMSDLLAPRSVTLGSDNPLAAVSFRPGSDLALRLASQNGSGRPTAKLEAELADNGEFSIDGSDVLSSAPSSSLAGDDEEERRKRRPYSYQQRQRKP